MNGRNRRVVKNWLRRVLGLEEKPYEPTLQVIGHPFAYCVSCHTETLHCVVRWQGTLRHTCQECADSWEVGQ